MASPAVSSQSTLSRPAIVCPSCPHPTPTPIPKLGTFTAHSAQQDTVRHYPSSVYGGALVQVSQGASVAIPWYCVTTAGGACPSNVTAYWSGGSSNTGLSVSFNTTVSSGAGPTTEYFTADPNLPPGLYSADVCLSSPQSFANGPECVSFLIAVTPAPNASFQAPPNPGSLQTTILLQLGHANSSSGSPLANFGHLYLSVYYGGIPSNFAFQSGPKYQAAIPPALLEVQGYTQQTMTDPAIDVTPYASLNSLGLEQSVYLSYQSLSPPFVPAYTGVSINSNTYIDAMLLDAGVSQATITGWVQRLQNATGLNALAFGNGSAITQCLIKRTAARLRPLTYGGCADLNPI